MQFERPHSKIRRVMLTARDANGRLPSKSVTIYDTTPEEAIRQIKEAFADSDEKQQTVPAQ